MDQEQVSLDVAVPPASATDATNHILTEAANSTGPSQSGPDCTMPEFDSSLTSPIAVDSYRQALGHDIPGEKRPSIDGTSPGNKENKKPKFFTKEEREADRLRREHEKKLREQERKRKREEEEDRRRRKKAEDEERKRRRKEEEEERKRRREEEDERKRKKREEEETQRRKKKEEEEQKRKEREVEREQKRKQKEEEKLRKEQEKQRKLQEKKLKEEKEKKAQPSIASFFTKTHKNPLLADAPPTAGPSNGDTFESAKNDFESCFLPFHVKSLTTMAPLHKFHGTKTSDEVVNGVDAALNGDVR
jgi:hypothetical protein